MPKKNKRKKSTRFFSHHTYFIHPCRMCNRWRSKEEEKKKKQTLDLLITSFMNQKEKPKNRRKKKEYFVHYICRYRRLFIGTFITMSNSQIKTKEQDISERFRISTHTYIYIYICSFLSRNQKMHFSFLSLSSCVFFSSLLRIYSNDRKREKMKNIDLKMILTLTYFLNWTFELAEWQKTMKKTKFD